MQFGIFDRRFMDSSTTQAAPTKEMVQFRGRNASLWQSAVDEVVAKQSVSSSPAAGFGGPLSVSHIKRPPQDHPAVTEGNEIAALLNVGAGVPAVPPPSAAAGLTDTAKFCATTALRMAEAKIKAAFTHDQTEVNQLQSELGTPFGECDPKWGAVLATYVKNRLEAGPIPYRRYSNLSDFVIDGRLPNKGTVVLIADWGTGQPAAKALLQQVASHKPDVVIHLGDVYYSGTTNEVQNYFYALWQPILGIPKVQWGQKLTDLTTGPATFHLPGNHDMYAGGGPYYTVIDMLGQPASYFCLRNDNWQFVAMDTSLHDSNPTTVDDATTVDPLEVAWMKDKVENAGGRKSILLSHHQLFTAYDEINKQAVNPNLLAETQDILPKLTAWIWGHEHNMVIYKEQMNVLGRCIGHGAFPVCQDPPQPLKFPQIPVEDVSLSLDPTGFYRHGYVLMDMDGPEAHLSYIQYDAEANTENVLFEEDL